MKYQLQIKPNELRDYAAAFGADRFSKFYGLGQPQGYLRRQELFDIRKEKSRRGAERIHQNAESLVQEVTAFAFRAKCEEARLGALTLLEGVSFPTASVILHCCVDQSYPILDFRAVWSLGIEKPSAYTLPFWCDYVKICRSIAAKHRMTVRELDKALWAYSRERSRA